MDGAVGLDGREVRVSDPPRYYADRIDDADDMPIFDTLPRVVRDALQMTVQKWTAQAARDALWQGMPARELAQYILKMDADKAREENVYGRP